MTNSIYNHHYVYIITDLYTNIKYIGSRTCHTKTIEDDCLYMSSSTDETFIRLTKDNPEQFKKKILKKCNSRREALFLEIDLHEYFNVGENPSFYNKAKQTSYGFCPNKASTLLSVKTRLKSNSYITGGIKTSKNHLILESNGNTKAKNRSIRSAKTMSIISEDSGLSIRMNSENKRIATRKKGKIYNGVKMSYDEYTGLKVKESLRKTTIFRDEMMTVDNKRQILSKESKRLMSDFFDLYKNNELILNGISRAILSSVNYKLPYSKNCISTSRSKIINGCRVIKTENINYDIFYLKDDIIKDYILSLL